MSTVQLKGTADILYTPQGGSPTVHTLAIPLLVSRVQEFTNRSNARVFEAWKADLTARETFTIGSVVDEIDCVLRMDDEPSSLRTMFREAVENDVTLTYRPTGSGGDTYPAKVVSAGGGPGQVVVVPDREMFGGGMHEVSFRFRRVDGGTFAGLL